MQRQTGMREKKIINKKRNDNSKKDTHKKKKKNVLKQHSCIRAEGSENGLFFLILRKWKEEKDAWNHHE